MIKQLKINDKIIDIYYDNTDLKELPIVILNTYDSESEDVWNKCKDIKCKEFILVAISNLDWNSDMSPWFAPKLNKHDVDCLGKADEYINLLINDIVPSVEKIIIGDLRISIEYYAIAGYSLAGLFAIYTAYKTDLFRKIASASGSFWFPNFIEFIKKNNISSNVKKIYFSLGDKESKVKNKVLATVEDNTKDIEKIYNLQGINTIYEKNEGNHFKDASLRMAKGIKWIID